jgi:hypothetical protein
VAWRTLTKLGFLASGAMAVVAPVALAGVAAADDAPGPAPQTVLTQPAVTSVSTGIKISIHVKGGTLQLSSDTIEVALRATSPGHLVGRYEGVRVLDARGTFPGWQLVARASALGGVGSLRVTPDPTVPVEGAPDGLLDAPTADVGSDGALLGGASAGHGAGVYELSGGVELDLDGGAAPDTVTLSLELR